MNPLPSGPAVSCTLLRTPFSLLGPASLAPKALFSGYKPTGLGIAENKPKHRTQTLINFVKNGHPRIDGTPS